MAQYVFDASKYPNGTLISELEFWKSLSDPLADYVVTEIGTTGRKYWKETDTSASKSMTSETTLSDYEILLLMDYTKAECIGSSYHGFLHCFYTFEGGTNAPIFSRVQATLDDSNTLSYNFAKPFSTNAFTVNDTPTGLLITKAMGFRFQLSNLENLKARIWAADVGGLEAAEPVAWGAEVDLGQASPVPSYYNTPTSTGSPIQSRFSSISIGTDGDPAPYPNPSVVIAAAPSAPTVMNTSPTTATVDWA